MGLTNKYEGNKGHGKTKKVYNGPAVDIAGLSVEDQYAVCRYAALFTYGKNAVKNVFGNAVKIGSANTVETINRMVNLGGLTGARPEEKAEFETAHPEWAATIQLYVDWQKAQAS